MTNVTANKLKGLEGSFLVSWDGWDEMGTMSLQFYKPVFRRDVGLPLDVIEEAEATNGVFTIDGENSSISIYYGVECDKVYEHQVKLTLGIA